MKSIIISIKPKWVKKILSGEKTLEIRKTAPKCELPCEVYIYCTKESKQYLKRSKWLGYPQEDNEFFVESTNELESETFNGKVVAKFTLNKVEQIENDKLWEIDRNFLERTCLSFGELASYLSSRTGYAWHIDNLVIFDKPKELEEFKHSLRGCSLFCDNNFVPSFCRNYCEHNKDTERLDVYCDINDKFGEPLTKAPQSWCYCEVNE